jgi:hypothetical protein
VSSDLSSSCLANCAKRASSASTEAAEANCESELLLMILDVVGVMSDVADGCSLVWLEDKTRMRPDPKPSRTAQIPGAIRSQRQSLFAEP